MKKTFALAAFSALLMIFMAGCKKDKEPVKIPLKLIVEDVTAKSAWFNVTAGKDDYWFVTAITKIDFESMSTAELVSAIEEEISSGGQRNIHCGSMRTEVKNLKDDTKYMACLLPVDAETKRSTGPLQSVEFTTLRNATMFEITISNITTIDADIKIVPENDAMTYCLGLTTRANLESFDKETEFMEHFKEFLISSNGSIEKSLHSGTFKGYTGRQKPGEEFIVFAFGMESDGTFTTSLAKEAFKTKEIEILDVSFDIRHEIEYNRFTFEIAPSDKQKNYHYAFIEESTLSDMSVEEKFKDDFESAIYSDLSLGYTPEEILEFTCKKGNFSDKKTLMSESNWYLVVAGVSNDLLIDTEIEVLSFKTKEAHIDYFIKPSVSNISSISADIKATFSGPMRYYYRLFKKEEVDKYETDAEFIRSLEYYGYVSGGYELEAEKHEINLEPGTEYCAVFIGYDEGPGTPSSRCYFTTLADGAIGSVTLDIHPYFSSCETYITASSLDFQYARYVTLKSDWDELYAANNNDTDKTIAAAYQKTIEDLIGIGWSENAAYELTIRVGDDLYRALDLNSNTDYVIWSIPVDANREPLTGGQFKEFKTGVYSHSDASAKIVNMRAFSNLELRETYPDAAWWAGDNPIVIYEIEANASAKHWFHNYSYRNPEFYGYDNAKYFEELYWGNRERDKRFGMYTGTWDEEEYAIAIAIDEKGNYGDGSFGAYTPNRDNLTPASEFPKELLKPIEEKRAKKTLSPVPTPKLNMGSGMPVTKEVKLPVKQENAKKTMFYNIYTK